MNEVIGFPEYLSNSVELQSSDVKAFTSHVTMLFVWHT